MKGFRQISPFLDPVAGVNARSLDQGQGKVGWAVEFQAPSIDAPQYLRWLQGRAEGVGVKVVKARIPTANGMEDALGSAEKLAQEGGTENVDVFINATGLGARELCGDDGVHPIRGQTVLVKGEAAATRTRHGDGYIAYCIPRPASGTTILGGTKEVGIWSTEVDPATTERTLQRARIMAPELLRAPGGGFEIISTQCGLRPGREGGPRVELERVGDRVVVHAYGHGGGGYQNSVGSAREVVDLVDKALGAGVSIKAEL